MAEIVKYADGVGIIGNPPAKEKKASVKFTFTDSVDGKAVVFTAGLKDVGKVVVYKPGDFIMRDQSGKRIKTAVFDKATGKPLASGYGYKDINEDGQEVTGEVRYFKVSDAGGEEEVSPFEKTDRVPIVKHLPRGAEDEYVVHNTAELFPDSEEDAYNMWLLAEFLAKNNLIATGIVVKRKGWQKYGIILIPYVDQKSGKFSIIARTVKEKLVFSGMREIPKAAPVPKTKGKTVETGVETMFNPPKEEGK